MSNELSDRYSPQEVETRIYSWWEKSGYFKAQNQSHKKPYCIIQPPPNVTGHLHLGHALNGAIQDVLIRWKRMSGYNALWLPGTDHAGIATQAVVEKNLKAEGQPTRQELGREKFLEKVWEWKAQYGDRIYKQMRRLGNSVDWDRATFTLDEGVSKAVRKVFVELYKKGQIYRGEKLVNWSSPLESAISDLEVEHKDTKGSLYHIKYAIEGTKDFLVLATTRPETYLGDTAVCVNPNDERYKHLKGKFVLLPLINKKIPVIFDDYVDMEFGTGVVKITPAHDFNDYEVGKRHNLPLINILNKNGTLNENGGQYQGLKVQEARKRIVADLEASGFMEKIETHNHSVGYCSRTGAVVEPFLSMQWFAKMGPLSVPARHVVSNGSITFEPESWTKTYIHWMNIIQDWCISRQLWWGHRIPAWYCAKCSHISVSESNLSQCEKCGDKNVKQDDDVLDTWFSSALWPFSTLGWPEKTEALKTFYPTNVLVTGHDIIFFWVARMIMTGLEFNGDVPFRQVYVHGLIRDSQGRKMSKSLGNSIDPLELIDSHGADALRFTLLAQIASGKDLKFSTQRHEGYRNFMNKIWNASRFCLQHLEGYAPASDKEPAKLDGKALSTADRWIIYRTGQVEKEVETHLDNMRFSDAANVLYSFAWHEFCDWYLEFSKPVLFGQDPTVKQVTQTVLVQTLNRILRLLHPFAPFITEEIYQKLPVKSEACIVAEYPKFSTDQAWLNHGSADAAYEMNLVMQVINGIRNIRGENSIKLSEKFDVWISPKDDRSQKIIGANKSEIIRLASIGNCYIEVKSNVSKCAVSPVVSGDSQLDIVVPLEGLVDIGEEVQRIKKLMEKMQKDISMLEGKLNNESFVKNAQPEVVEADKLLLAEHKAKFQRLTENLSRLS